jgi:hypothetical protein
MSSEPNNSFANFTPVEDSTHLTSKQEYNHFLLANVICKQLTGYYLHEVNSTTVPTPGSLAYKSLLSPDKREKGFTRWDYYLPNKKGESASESNKDPYFMGTPVVYLIRGPNKHNKHDSSDALGLDYFRSHGVKPTMDYLNEVFMSLDMRVDDYTVRYEASKPPKGYLMLIFNTNTFVKRPRAPREDAEASEH